MKKKFNLKKEYEKSLNYIKDNRNFIYVIIGVFLFSALIGFLIPAPDSIVQQIMIFIEELMAKTKDLSLTGLTGFIFFNNLQSSFFGIVFGIVLGIFPLFATIINGYLLGFVSALSVQNGGILSLWKLFPHGIFELPAIFISFGLGLKLGLFFFNRKKETFRECLGNSLRVFLLIILPLLIIAAIIEGILIFLI